MRNAVSAKVRKLDILSKALDEAVSAGGNDVRVQNVAFTVDEPDRARNEARDRAVADARVRAEQLAKASGAKLGRVRSLSESGGVEPVRTMFDGKPAAAAGQASAPDTPLDPGQARISVTVAVVYEIE